MGDSTSTGGGGDLTFSLPFPFDAILILSLFTVAISNRKIVWANKKKFEGNDVTNFGCGQVYEKIWWSGSLVSQEPEVANLVSLQLLARGSRVNVAISCKLKKAKLSSF